MVSECCLGVVKYFVFLFNLIFFFLGLLMLSLGVWMTFAETNLFKDPPFVMPMSLLSYFLLIGGSLTMTLGFLGCLGALQEIKCLLGLYFVLLTILLAAQSVGGVLFITQKSIFESSLTGHMSKVILLHVMNVTHLQAFEEALDYLQQKLECCGWVHPDDWHGYTPCSCYGINGTHLTSNSSTSLACHCEGNMTPTNTSLCVLHQQGCGKEVEKLVDDHMFLILVVLFALIGVEGVLWLLMLVLHCLSCSPRHCCPVKSRSRRLHISSDFYMEYWQDLWYDPFDVSV